MSTVVEKLSKLTDNLVGIVSPRRRLMREKIRSVEALRAFNGASNGRLLRDWVTTSMRIHILDSTYLHLERMCDYLL